MTLLLATITAGGILLALIGIAALLDEVERLRGQIDAVREHHVPVEANYYAATVTECCSCPGPWPCPTIRALDGEGRHDHSGS